MNRILGVFSSVCAALLVTIALGIINPTPAHAGLFLCNDTGVTLNIAYGLHEQGQWTSRGWYTVKPRDCMTMIQGLLTNKYYYYYAEGGGLTFDGGSEAGFFCINDPQRFYYSQRAGCYGKSFRRIDIGNSVLDRYVYTLHENTTDPLDAANNCAGEMSDGREAFAKCWMRQIATVRQRQILDCVDSTTTNASMAICAFKGSMSGDSRRIADCAQQFSEDRIASRFARCVMGDRLSDENKRLIDCAIAQRGSFAGMATCAAGGQLSGSQRALYNCVASNLNDYKAAGLCMVSSRMSADQQRIIGCVASNRGSYVQMGVCAAGGNLTPEQQAFVECAVTSGGQPYAYAGCVGTRLTMNEIDKCFSQGIGGRGCFGDKNTIVQTVHNMWKDVTKGPGPSNDLVGRDGAVVTAMRNAWRDVTEGPGKNNEFCKIGLCF